MGKAMREFRRATSEIGEAVLHENDDEEEDEHTFPTFPQHRMNRHKSH